MNGEGDWITTGEAARLLGVRSINTVKKLIREGRLTAIRPGDHYRVALSDVEKLRGRTRRTHGSNPMARLTADWLTQWADQHRVQRIWLFGSAARDELRLDSDVDVAIEFREDARGGLFELVAMQEELADRVGRPVDLGTLPSMRPYVRRNAEADMVLIHEG